MLAIAGCCVVVGISVWVLVFTRSRGGVDLQNKVVLVTGASSGLGRASCFAFCRRRCRLVLCSRRVDDLKKLREELVTYAAINCGFELKAEVLPLDISDLDKVAPALESTLVAFGQRLDVLVNNAGVSFRGLFEETEVAIFERIMRVNFVGQVAITKAALPYMLEAGEGHIVGVGSVQGKIAQPERAPYAASKHACQAFYDSLRAELASRNIFISVMNPSYIRTNLSVNAITGDGTTYGRMDATTSSGYDAFDVAEEIVEMVTQRKKEQILAPFHHKLAVWLRNILPSLYFWIMAERAAKLKA